MTSGMKKACVPWGSWNLNTGVWHHNPLLGATREAQHHENLLNGYSCPHEYLPSMCLICE
jgi:hypothetical protein